MPQRAIAAVAGDGPVVHLDDFGRAGGGAVHFAARALYGRGSRYDSDATHAFNHHQPGTRRRWPSAVLPIRNVGSVLHRCWLSIVARARDAMVLGKAIAAT